MAGGTNRLSQGSGKRLNSVNRLFKALFTRAPDQGPVESGTDGVKGAAVDLLAADGPESGRPAGA